MKEYMLIYRGGDPKWMENTSQQEMAESMRRWGAWMSDLQANERLVSGGSPLNFEGKRISKDGIVTDISAAEFKELVTGYSIILAETIDEAIVLAKACPIFNYPDITVEVREVTKMD